MSWTSIFGKSFPVTGLSFGDVATVLGLWRHRARSRRQLRWLDQRQLQDIGLDRLQAMEEAYKPFWRR